MWCTFFSLLQLFCFFLWDFQRSRGMKVYTKKLNKLNKIYQTNAAGFFCSFSHSGTLSYILGQARGNTGAKDSDNELINSL